MGYTSFTVEKLERIIAENNPKSVIDLGAQNMYNQPKLPAPYAKDWYKAKGIGYASFDLNGENGSWRYDLSKYDDSVNTILEIPISGWFDTTDLLVDAGTSEHVSNGNGKFNWEAIYNCWNIKHSVLKIGGIMYNENPKHFNWPLHGCNYYTEDFYRQLASLTDYEILNLGEHPAMNNTTDGWNIFCTLKKHSDKFPSIEDFKTLPIFQS